MIGVRYSGALHLRFCFLNAFLQIPACRQAGYAALPLKISPKCADYQVFVDK